MKFINLKMLVSSSIIASMLVGCASSSGNQPLGENQNAIIGTTIGAIAGIVLGNNVGGGNKD